MANDNLTLEKSATQFLGNLTNNERESLAAFLSSETALLDLKTHLPYEFVRLVADVLSRAGLN
jgi:hypothetical protein